jgi:hypothetical protein
MTVWTGWSQRAVALAKCLADGHVGGEPKSKRSSQVWGKREVVAGCPRGIGRHDSIDRRLYVGSHGEGPDEGGDVRSKGGLLGKSRPRD